MNNFFKVRHKDKKLEYKSCAKCLKKYQDTSQSINFVTIPGLQNILGQIQNSLFEEVDHNTNVTMVKNSSQFEKSQKRDFLKNLNTSSTNVSRSKFQYLVHLYKSFEYGILIFKNCAVRLPLKNM